MGLADQIVKRLRPILSGKNLVTHLVKSRSFLKNVILSEAKLQRSPESVRGEARLSISDFSSLKNNPRCLKALPYASHFVAALRST
jgi:hypothetical protein